MEKIKFSKTKLAKVAKQYKIAEVYLFGSKVEGFQRKESDLDIGVRFKNNLPKEGERGKVYGNLFADLSSCFRDEKIDLVFIDEVPLHFQFKIVALGELVYSQDLQDAFNFKERIINYYLDYKYFIDEFFEGILKTA